MEPMHLEIAQETEYFFLSCLLGAGLGLIYDFIRVFRNTVTHNKVVVFIEDFLYASFFGFSFFFVRNRFDGRNKSFCTVRNACGLPDRTCRLGKLDGEAVVKGIRFYLERSAFADKGTFR